MHEYIPVAITLIAILGGVLMNRSDVHQLRAEMRAELKEVRTDIQSLRTETRAEIKDVRSEIQVLRAEMNHNFDRVDERFKRVDEHFMRVDERFGHVEERFTKVDYALMQFFTIAGKQEGRIDEIAKRA